MTGNKKKRKPRRVTQKKSYVEPLPTKFDCLFCNQQESCEVKMDKVRRAGRITCMVCLECFQTRIHNLSEPVDVYNDWVDACEDANKDVPSVMPT